MKIEEAIELLEQTPIGVLVGDDLKWGKARQLSIEALKWYKAHRPIYPPASLHLLPGED